MNQGTSRRSFLKSIGAIGLYAGLASCAGSVKTKPNIIFILADDLGYGDLGCYGQQQVQTPNLDRMALQGMRFTDCYAGSTVCAPSRCSLMTGLHSGHSRVRGNATVPLSDKDVTIAKLLKSAGYRTALIGKWGLGEAGSSGIPNRQGFDYFYGYLNQIKAHNYYPEFLWRNEDKVFLDNKVITADKGYARGVGGASTKQVEYSHDLFSQEALEFVQQNREHPFFLYLAYTIPHANNEHWILNTHGMETPDYGIYRDKDWPEAQKGFAAMVSRMDRDIGELLKKLHELGIDENTLVIFSSDNGTHKEGLFDPDFFDSNGPLRGMKRDLYDGGIRVPMIAWWPGKITEGSTSDLPCAFWDILPTCAQAAGVPAPENIDGVSLLPTFLGRKEEQKKRQFLYWEFHERGVTEQAVRMGKWKAVRHDANGPLELYDLSVDIGEANDIAAEHPDIAAKIENYLARARTPNEHWPLKSKL